MDALVITDSELNKKGIILFMGDDLHWYIYKKDRGKHHLSNALRTGCVKQTWSDLESITCSEGCIVSAYNRAKHLAELAGLEIRETNEYDRKLRERAIEMGVDEVTGYEYLRIIDNLI